MGHFFSKVSLFIDKKEAAAHLILDQDFATAPFLFIYFSLSSTLLSVFLSLYRIIKILMNEAILTMRNTKKKRTNKPNKRFKRSV